jgi:hypothetical protein
MDPRKSLNWKTYPDLPGIYVLEDIMDETYSVNLVSAFYRDGLNRNDGPTSTIQYPFPVMFMGERMPKYLKGLTDTLDDTLLWEEGRTFTSIKVTQYITKKSRHIADIDSANGDVTAIVFLQSTIRVSVQSTDYSVSRSITMSPQSLLVIRNTPQRQWRWGIPVSNQPPQTNNLITLELSYQR